MYTKFNIVSATIILSYLSSPIDMLFTFVGKNTDLKISLISTVPLILVIFNIGVLFLRIFTNKTPDFVIVNDIGSTIVSHA